MGNPNDLNSQANAFITSPYVCDVMDQIQPFLVNRKPIEAGERLALPHPNSLKRAALLVDRIYIPCFASSYKVSDIPVELTFGDPQLDKKTFDKTYIYPDVDFPWKISDPTLKLNYLLTDYLREPLARYRTSFPQSIIVPINYAVGTAVVPEGETVAYEGVLRNLPVVIEESLSWQQVLQFRKDPEARRKYRDLHLWLEQSLGAQSVQQSTDIVGQKLDDYRWAIKKHGLKTTLEAASSIVSVTAFVPPVGGLVAEALRLEPVWGAIAAGAAGVAGITAWIGKRLLDLQELKREQYREVAYVYDIQELAKGGQ